LIARADFDGDGKTDEAVLVVSTSGPASALVVIRGGAKAPIVLEEFNAPGWLDAMGVEVAKPGSYPTVCGKSYVACKPDEAKVVVLKRPGIDLFKEGSANSIFIYDDGAKVFRRAWISD
jgi:hypothetical protein